MNAPLLSVIIPTYNRVLMLERCLESFSMQTLHRDKFEVIVVDDGSSDHTRSLLKEKSFPFTLRAHFQNHGGAAKARNAGISQARGKILVFTDDDCVPVPSFLAEHALLHRQSANRLVRGPILIVRSFHETESIKPSPFSFSMNFFCTSNASLQKNHLLSVGGFDESFARWEDAELGFRLRKLGLKMMFNMKAIVHHLKPVWKLADLIRTALADGESARKLYQRHPSLRTWFSTGFHPFNVLPGRAMKPWIDHKISKMHPDDLVNGMMERLIFQTYFVEGLKGR